jgi:hypothetical protein
MKILQRLIIWLSISCFFIVPVLSQESHLNLTAQQMYEDFDSFVSIVQNHTSRLNILKEVSGYDALEHIKRQCGEIDKLKNTGDFHFFMQGIMRCIIDPHASMIKYDSPFNNQAIYTWSLNHIDTLKTNSCISFFRHYLEDNIHRNFSLGNYLLYHEGEDSVMGYVTLYNGKDSVSLHDTKLVKIGHHAVDDFIGHFPEQQRTSPRWDFKLKKYFSHSLCVPAQILTFQHLISKKNIIVDVTDYSNTRLVSPEPLNHANEDIQLVEYLEEQKILYIRVPENTKYVGQELLSQLDYIDEHAIIKKVILDVRGNRGGSDYVWLNLLSKITKDTIRIARQLAIANSPNMLKIYNNGDTVNFLKGVIFGQDVAILEDTIIIMPDNDNLGYTGEFYVLQDVETASSAHSLSSICRYTPRFTSVGIPTGYIAGWGSGVFFFQLPHSGITFSLNCDADISNSKFPVDYYQDIPEIEVFLSYEDLKKLSFRRTISKKELLVDPFIMKILNLF